MLQPQETDGFYQKINCHIIVPTNGGIEPACEASLDELERRGYNVNRVFGFSAPDLIRSITVTNALRDGAESILFIDHDIAFDPDDIDKLLQHNLPFICATYYMKGQGKCVTNFTSDKPVPIGVNGGLYEAKSSGMGFNYIKRDVFEAVLDKLPHKYCGGDEDNGMTPYFQPTIVKEDGVSNYLMEDFAFCHRAREAGYPLMCDTSIILFHVGRYAYSVLDAGKKPVQQFFNPVNCCFGAEQQEP